MIHIGTSGYSYKDWIGPFYPQGTKQGDMLAFYAGHFGFTEINSTYYQIPNSFMLFNMQKKTGDNFVFSVKLHQSMTHLKNASEQDYKSFTDAIDVLKDTGKLGCLVAQFPYSFHCNDQNRDYIKSLKDRFMDYAMVIEFRNNKWINDETFELLRQNNLGYVCVDEPELLGLIGRRSLSTSNTAYIRLHGRNRQKWWNHEEAYERYDYLYSREELEEWTGKIQALDEACGDCFVSFNNHFRAQAVMNGKMLTEMLEA